MFLVRARAYTHTHTRTHKWQLYELLKALSNTKGIILQYKSYQHIVYFKLMQRFMSMILEKRRNVICISTIKTTPKALGI